MLLYDAARIADSLSLPEQEVEGTVASVHAGYLNIMLAGETITLFRVGSATVPFGIEVAGTADWRGLGLEGNRVCVGPAEIEAPSFFKVKGLREGSRFSSRASHGLRHRESLLVDRLGKLHKICLGSPKFGGILSFLGAYKPMDGWKYQPAGEVVERRLQGSFEALLAGTANDDDFLIVEGVHGLMGLGPGLTPSGDDFLLGFLAGLTAVQPEPGNQAAAKLARCLAQDAPARTTAVAASFLKYATQGQYHQYLVELIDLFRDGDEAPMLNAAQRLLTLGHFSGTDLLLGFAFGGFAALRPGMYRGAKR
jgi:hypothetical protein